MPLATDRDPSGVKQKNPSLTTGPQIGNVFLARSQEPGEGQLRTALPILHADMSETSDSLGIVRRHRYQWVLDAEESHAIRGAIFQC